MYPDDTPTVAVVITCDSGPTPTAQSTARPLSRRRKVGYARVAATDPFAMRNAVKALLDVGVDSERITVESSTTNGPREYLRETLNNLHPGDRLLVPSLASLARSQGELSRILRHLERIGVDLWVGGHHYAALGPEETAELLEAMKADLHLEAAIEDRERLAAFKDDRRGLKRHLTAVESLALREDFDQEGSDSATVAAQWRVSRAVAYRAAGPSVIPRKYGSLPTSK